MLFNLFCRILVPELFPMLNIVYSILMFPGRLSATHSFPYPTRSLGYSVSPLKWSGSFPEICFYFFAVEEGIIPPYNAPFHQKGCCPADNGCRKRGPGHGSKASVHIRSLDIHTRGHKIRLGQSRSCHADGTGTVCIASAGKICIGIIDLVIGSHGDHLGCGRRNGQCHLGCGTVESGTLPIPLPAGRYR